MKRTEYLEMIKEKTGVNKQEIDLVIKEYFELLKEKIKSEKRANITNFGTFTLKTTKPHTVFSPVDGRSIKTKGINKIYFSTSKDFKSNL